MSEVRTSLQRLIKDCNDAAKALADTNTFESGQSIFLEAADRLAAMEAEIERLRGVIEKDRSDVASILGKIKSAIGGRAWMKETRGSYCYDDERFMAEFGAALDEIETAAEPLHLIARDWRDCPTDAQEIAKARSTIRAALTDDVSTGTKK